VCGDAVIQAPAPHRPTALNRFIRSIVPDLLSGVRGEQGSETLGDVKTLSHNRSGYTRARVCGDGRPVGARADKVNSEYDSHAIMVNSKFNGCPRYERDPVTNDIRRARAAPR
jgi:hypothetical protein